LPHLPEVPTARRDALRQHGACRSAIGAGAKETRNGDRVQGSGGIGLAGIATVAPENGMAAAGTPLGAIRLRLFPKGVNVLR